MLKLNPEIMAALERQGTKQQFCLERTKLIHNGKSSAEAQATALEKWYKPAPDDPALPAVSESPQEGTARFQGWMAEQRRVPKSVFRGKKCTYREMVEWVADNYDTAGIKARDAPSGAAWTFLKFSRASLTNLGVFCKDIYAKIHQAEIKSESDEGGPFSDDGKARDLPDWLRSASS